MPDHDEEIFDLAALEAGQEPLQLQPLPLPVFPLPAKSESGTYRIRKTVKNNLMRKAA